MYFIPTPYFLINKYNYYRMAKAKSIQKNKQLIVIGDPYSGSPPKSEQDATATTIFFLGVKVNGNDPIF